MGDLLSVFAVAPLVGARIEMGHVDKGGDPIYVSLPTRERGLK